MDRMSVPDFPCIADSYLEVVNRVACSLSKEAPFGMAYRRSGWIRAGSIGSALAKRAPKAFAFGVGPRMATRELRVFGRPP